MTQDLAYIGTGAVIMLLVAAAMVAWIAFIGYVAHFFSTLNAPSKVLRFFEKVAMFALWVGVILFALAGCYDIGETFWS